MTTFKNNIGGKDIKHWDGVTRNFTRTTSTGGTLTQNKVGHMVDVLEAYGDGENYTLAAITAATGAIGSSNVTMMLQTGTWTITDDLTIVQNIRLWTEKGVTIDVSAGKTLTLNCTLPTSKSITFSGSGTVVTDPSDQTLTVTGNIILGANAVDFDSTAGAFTATLRDGVNGQLIACGMTTDGGDVTLSVTTHKSGNPTTFTFDDVGDYMLLTWTGSQWETVYDSQNGFTVAQGGTGATSLTDGGLLLGSGTGAITPMAVLADSEMVVGDGTTDPVPESGATLRTSIGVGIGDSPQFTGIELSHATANTLTGSGGDALIEGTVLKKVGKETIWIPAEAITPTTTQPCASLTLVEAGTNDVDYNVLDFDASSDEYANFRIQFPKSWNEGTVTFQVAWTSTATDTDGVAWGLQGVALADDETIDSTWGTAVVVTDDNISAAGDMLITSESSAVTIAGSPSTDETVIFRIFRDVSDGNDDMTEDARLLGIRLFFTTSASEDT